MIRGTGFEDVGSGRAGAGGTSGVLMVLTGDGSGVLGFLSSRLCAVCWSTGILWCVGDVCAGSGTSTSSVCAGCFTDSCRGEVCAGVVAEGSLGSWSFSSMASLIVKRRA